MHHISQLCIYLFFLNSTIYVLLFIICLISVYICLCMKLINCLFLWFSLFICLPVHVCICLFSLNVSIHVFMFCCPSTVSFLSVCLCIKLTNYICLSLCLSVFLFVLLSICLLHYCLHLSIYVLLFIHLPHLCLSLNIIEYLCVLCVSTCQYVCLFPCFFFTISVLIFIILIHYLSVSHM